MAFFLAPLLAALGGAATVVPAAAALAGGAISARNQRKAREEEYRRNDPAFIRAQREAAGYHPSFDAGGRMSSQAFKPVMGQAIASAGRLWSETMFREQELELQRTELQQRNEQLTRRLEQQVLRAPVGGGIYDRRTRATVVDSVSEDGEVPSVFPHGDRDINSAPSGPVGVNENVAPTVTVFGNEYRGTGYTSNGQTFEDALGEGIITNVLTAPIIATDIALGSAYRGATMLRDDFRASSAGQRFHAWMRGTSATTVRTRPSGTGPLPVDATPRRSLDRSRRYGPLSAASAY